MWKPTYAHICSALYFCCYGLVGAALSSLGPSLLDLTAQTSSDVAQISYVFPIRSVAYLIGSAIGGPSFDRFPGHRLLAFAMTLACIGTSVIPICKAVGTLAAAASVQGLAIGFLDTGANVLLIYVHGDDKVAPFLQLIHFAFGLGAFLAPLLVNLSVHVIGGPSMAFWVLGALFAPVAVCLLIIKSPTPDAARRENEAVAAKESGEAAPARARLNARDIVLVALAALLMFLYVGTEIGEGSYIFTYAVVYVGFTESHGHYLTSVFWGCLALGRLIAVPVSVYVASRNILLFNFTGSLLSVALIAAFPHNTTILWVNTVLYGLFMSCIWPTVLNMLQTEVPLNAKLTSVLVISGAIGEMIVPLALSILFEGGVESYIWLIYLLVLGGALSLLALFAFIIAAHLRRKWQAKYRAIQGDEEGVVQMDDDELNGADSGQVAKWSDGDTVALMGVSSTENESPEMHDRIELQEL